MGNSVRAASRHTIMRDLVTNGKFQLNSSIRLAFTANDAFLWLRWIYQTKWMENRTESAITSPIKSRKIFHSGAAIDTHMPTRKSIALRNVQFRLIETRSSRRMLFIKRQWRNCVQKYGSINAKMAMQLFAEDTWEKVYATGGAFFAPFFHSCIVCRETNNRSFILQV